MSDAYLCTLEDLCKPLVLCEGEDEMLDRQLLIAHDPTMMLGSRQELVDLCLVFRFIQIPFWHLFLYCMARRRHWRRRIRWLLRRRSPLIAFLLIVHPHDDQSEGNASDQAVEVEAERRCDPLCKRLYKIKHHLSDNRFYSKMSSDESCEC